MTLETGVKALAEAVGADVKALESGKVNTTDSRLTDSREWSATTVTQAEAEEGTASTRRAWTAQRVRQAINAWWQLVTSGFGRNFIAATNEQSARNVLQLGTAATRDITTSAADATGGRLIKVGDYGIYNTNAITAPSDLNIIERNGIYYANADTLNAPFGASTMLEHKARNVGFSCQLAQSRDASRMSIRHQNSGIWGYWREVYHTGNTTKNPDGTLKASSPVINLYTDHHDLHNEEQFGATPAVTRKSKGVYEITGTLGLRSQCWYLDTPNDRNGNKYFNIEWTQNITPTAVDGIVEEYRDDIVVTIETFERVWNKETGIFENGAPIDINELQDRFVQLRFNEIKVEHKELDDETITRNQE